MEDEKKYKELEEKKNKQLIKYMYILVCSVLIFFLEAVFLAVYFIHEGPVLVAIMISNVILFFILCLFALEMERDAGYYECAKCHNKHVPTYKAVVFAPHINTTRWLKCPECGKRSWSKKVMTK